MWLYGAGGHAKVILEILEARRVRVDGFFDDRDQKNDLFGYPVQRFSDNAVIDQLLLAIGNNRVRKELATRIVVNYARATHPSAIVSERAKIGEGSVVMAGSVVNTSTSVGRHCIVNVNAIVDHDCVLSDFVHVAPGACLCGGVTVGEGTWIGAGAVIQPGIKIGSWLKIEPGAIVLEDHL